MSASDIFEADLLKLIFQAVAIAGIAINHTTTPLTDLSVGLHTADPGEGGTENTSEATYTGYARVAVPRTAAGFSITGSVISNAAAVGFAQCTAGNNSITHFTIGDGAGKQFVRGALAAPLAVSAGITPSFAIGELTATAD